MKAWKLQGMPRRVSDDPDAFTGWNFISSIGSIISVAATVLFLQIVYLQLVKGKAVFGYPWAVPQLFSDYLRILKDKTAPGLEWALDNPPKPHAFTSLPLQSVSIPFSKYVAMLLPIATLYYGFSGYTLNCDAPRAWGLYFQDSASPQMEALVELHDNIMYYLVAILFSVGWIQGAIIKNFDNSKFPISNKYLNHGICVPIQKCSNKYIFKYNHTINKRSYTSLCKNKDIEIFPAKVYENAFSLRKDIIKENKGLSGIYLLTNKLTDEIYVGQSIDLSKRFIRYFNLSYLKSKESLIISRALIKYGYVNFSVSILEYCDKSILTEREQYYLDKLEPKYNILKIAGSSLGYKHSEVSKQKRSKALKGVYVGIKSHLFGKNHTIETKNKMSLQRKGENNYFYGKTHIELTKENMRQKALDRKHSIETKDKISKAHGNPVYVYEKTDLEGFKLIGSFVSARRAAKFLDMSGTTVIKYMKSGEVFKNRYKFSSN